MTPFDRVCAVLAAATAGAVFSAPHAIKLLTGGIYQRCLISEYSGLKVAAVAALHTYGGSRQVGGPDIGCLEVEYKNFEMEARIEHPFQSGFQNWVAIEIFTEYRPRFLGMYKPISSKDVQALREMAQMNCRI